VTSVLYWIMAYFFVRYGLLAGQIDSADFWTGVVLGALTVGAFLTFVPTVVVPGLIRSRVPQTTR
jgi:multisubunit Na+/H+ antiporter MnhE subunit